MSDKQSQRLIDIDNRAEGSSGEINEPDSPRRTATLPVIDESRLRAASQTGLIPMATFGVEGTDKTDAQDASLTKDETALPQANSDTRTTFDADTRVLIVEDTVELAEVIQATLEGMGLNASHATHGKTGLDLLKELEPALLLLDIGLPDMSGWQILDEVKDHYEGQQTSPPPTIIITAYGDPANRLVGKLQNIHSYLIKPFTPNQVEKIVTMALNGKKPENPTIGGEETSSSK